MLTLIGTILSNFPIHDFQSFNSFSLVKKRRKISDLINIKVSELICLLKLKNGPWVLLNINKSFISISNRIVKTYNTYISKIQQETRQQFGFQTLFITDRPYLLQWLQIAFNEEISVHFFHQFQMLLAGFYQLNVYFFLIMLIFLFFFRLRLVSA